MAVNLIAAIGKNNELGKDNALIWHFKEDMQFFKETTMGSAVIMGRKTFESLPKALPGRRNIVISSDPAYPAKGAEVVTSVKDALNLAGTQEVFVIGGGRVYEEMLPLCDCLYLTEIEDECAAADTYFPTLNKEDFQREVIRVYNKDGVRFSHVRYQRKG